MRESRPYGSVRGALSNERPYRDFSFPLLLVFLPSGLDFPSAGFANPSFPAWSGSSPPDASLDAVSSAMPQPVSARKRRLAFAVQLTRL